MIKWRSEMEQDRECEESIDLLDRLIIGWYETTEEARKLAFSVMYSYLHRN